MDADLGNGYEDRGPIVIEGLNRYGNVLVCALKTVEKLQIVQALIARLGGDITAPWVLLMDGTFVNPIQCYDHQERFHWLFSR